MGDGGRGTEAAPTSNFGGRRDAAVRGLGPTLAGTADPAPLAASRPLLPLPYLKREATLRDIQLLRAAIPRRTDAGRTRRK